MSETNSDEQPRSDWWHKAIKLVDHNRYIVIGAVLFAALVWQVGCESTTTFKGGSLNRQQLNAEAMVLEADLKAGAAALQAKADAASAQLGAAHADLDRQDEARAKIIEVAGGLVTAGAAGTINPASAIASVLGAAGLLFGGGAVMDNRRKDKVILDLRNGDG